MENIPTYNARKHGEEEVASIHPKIDHLVKETQGVIVYQETGDADRPRTGRLFRSAKPISCAAPWARRYAPRWTSSAWRFVDGAVGTRRGEATGQLHFRPGSPSSPITASNKSHAAAYALVSLPHGLSEGALSDRIPRRLDDVRHVEYRQAERFSAPTRCVSTSRSRHPRC